MKTLLSLGLAALIGWWWWRKDQLRTDPTVQHIERQHADQQRSVAANTASLAHRPAIAMIGAGPLSGADFSLATARTPTIGPVKFRPIAPGADTGTALDGLVTIQPPFDPLAGARIQKIQAG